LGAACAIAARSMAQEAKRIGELRDRLDAGLLNAVPSASVNGADADRLWNTTNICFGDIDGEALLARLDRIGILASSGAACSAAGPDPSHVLTAMGLGRDQATASVRFSLSRFTSAAEIETVIGVAPAIVRELASNYEISAAAP
jgi:cysteine desulfurase